jgi:hypothetical protein
LRVGLAKAAGLCFLGICPRDRKSRQLAEKS